MFSKDRLLETAKASPQAVARHDKSAWLNLFAQDAEVHDPVGSQAHRGRAALERFYDTFIAPNQIHFKVDHDIVSGQTVVRDLVIETRMGGTALQVDVPLYIRYEIVNEAGQPKVHRLYAHWELLPMMRGQVFKDGLATGLIALVKLSRNMLSHQGLAGALGFSRAFTGVGANAKRTAEHFLRALADGDDIRASLHLALKAQLQHNGSPIGLAPLREQLSGLSWRKMLAGGRQVTVSLDYAGQRALALFDFARDSAHISALRIYSDTA